MGIITIMFPQIQSAKNINSHFIMNKNDFPKSGGIGFSQLKYFIKNLLISVFFALCSLIDSNKTIGESKNKKQTQL
jgi:hypothetical protein